MKFIQIFILIITIFCNVYSQQAGLNCCCGTWTQLSYPNLDFEDGPNPPTGGFIVYGAGSVFGGWTVTRATIDHVEASHAGLGNGNPNGASNFVDLHGSPGFGGISYKLTNLKPGATYRIEFWTAQNGGNHSSTGTLKIAGGAWLNESWTVTISGAILWFKLSYMFMAMDNMADMEFSSVGDLIYAGTLVDDISIFECPGDTEAPQIVNEPLDESYNCLEDVPSPPIITVTDDCDINPTIKYSQKINKLNDCEQTIDRKWEVSDHCGNTSTYDQQIQVKDNQAPNILIPANDKIVDCSKHSDAVFKNWLNSQGGAKASDNCKEVFWEYFYDKLPKEACDTSIVQFVAKDYCGNESNLYALYIIKDNNKPLLIKPADSVQLRCSSSAKDSLRQWLLQHGNAIASDSCSSLIWKNNFNGDSNSLRIQVEFLAIDKCGNTLKIPGLFEQLDAPDTNYINTFHCDDKLVRVDTNYFSLPGCDSVVINQSIGVKTDSTFLSELSCKLNEPTIYTVLKSTHSCDSIVVTSYTYIKPDTTLNESFVCGLADTLINYRTLQGQLCDSVVIDKQIPRKNYSLQITNFSCDSNQTGIKNLFLKDQFGCDSTIIIETKYSPISISRADSSICALKTSYFDTTKLVSNGCDSFHIVHFIAKKIDSTFIRDFTCDPALSGIKIFHFFNQDQCDSVVVTNTILESVPNKYLQKTICSEKKNLFDTLFLKSFRGCDSLIITENIYFQPDTTFIFQNTCDTTLSGQFTQILKGQHCDSVIITDRHFIPSYTVIQSQRTCSKDSARVDSVFLQSVQLCDSLVITRYEYFPIIPTYKIGQISCFGYNDGMIEITSFLSARNPVQVFLNGQRYLNTFTFDLLKKGSYELVIRDADDCISDTININLDEPNPFFIDIGPDITTSPSKPVLLKEKSNLNFSKYSWIPPSIFDCPNCAQSNANPSKDTQVSLIVEDENGCQSIDSLWIRIKKSSDYYVPNVFSPNGDNVNERFFISGSEDLIIQWLKIYDRWGNLVFDVNHPRINQPTDGWDGQFKNKPLNPSVYSYVFSIQLEGEQSKIISGDVTLMR